MNNTVRLLKMSDYRTLIIQILIGTIKKKMITITFLKLWYKYIRESYKRRLLYKLWLSTYYHKTSY